MRRLLAVALEANGYRVQAAASGQEGLVLAAQHRPALVLLDIGLPEDYDRAQTELAQFLP